MRAIFSFFPYFSLLSFFILFPSPAYAYLDPGTGSMALQLLAAGILGALFTLKSHWIAAKNFVFSLFRRPRTPQGNG